MLATEARRAQRRVRVRPSPKNLGKMKKNCSFTANFFIAVNARKNDLLAISGITNTTARGAQPAAVRRAAGKRGAGQGGAAGTAAARLHAPLPGDKPRAAVRPSTAQELEMAGWGRCILRGILCLPLQRRRIFAERAAEERGGGPARGSGQGVKRTPAARPAPSCSRTSAPYVTRDPLARRG